MAYWASASVLGFPSTANIPEWTAHPCIPCQVDNAHRPVIVVIEYSECIPRANFDPQRGTMAPAFEGYTTHPTAPLAYS